MISLCILFGGASSEHDVSLMSATSVLRHINKERYRLHTLGITRDGRWLYYDGPVELIQSGDWESSLYVTPAVISPDRTHRGILLLDGSGTCIPLDAVFPVLHGKNGEDGTVQGMLELAGIPYVGCNVLASAVCMDKEVSHILLRQAGVPKTRLAAVRPEDLEREAELARRLEGELGYPMFVKPACAGSSVGVTKVKRAADLRPALELALSHDAKAVVEQAVEGQEVECAVLGNENPVASAVLGEIAPTNEFYDYEGKYLDDSTDLYVPAHVDEKTAQRIRELAVKSYRALGCGGMARVDFFVRPGGEVVLNELNTIPGFTRISMYPRLFAESGLPFGRLIDELVDWGLRRQTGIPLQPAQ